MFFSLQCIMLMKSEILLVMVQYIFQNHNQSEILEYLSNNSVNTTGWYA